MWPLSPLVPRATRSHSFRLLLSRGSQRRGHRSCWAEPPDCSSQGFPGWQLLWGPGPVFPCSQAPARHPHKRGRGFCPSPGQRSPCHRVLRQPGRWTPRSSPLPLSCHLPTPVPSRHQPVSAGRAARRTNPPGSARGSEVGDCRHSKGWPAPDPQPPAPQLPVPSHPQHLPEDPQGGSGLQTG